MPTVLLTAKFMKHVEPPATGRLDYYDTQEPGLVLRVAASGRKTWNYYYRMPGSRRKRRFTIDKVLSLAKARGEVLKLRQQVKNEGRPRRRASRLEVGADLQRPHHWYETDHQEEVPRRGNAHRHQRTAPHWRDRKIHELTRADIRAILTAIAERPAPVMANRVSPLSAGSTTSPSNTMSRASRPTPPPASPSRGKETPRDRALTRKEIRTLWTACEQAQHPPRVDDVDPDNPPVPIAPLMALGLQLILVTGQRPGEVFGMRRADLDEKKTWWTIPKTLTKNANTHRVPLTKTAKTLIKAAIEAGPKDPPMSSPATKAPRLACEQRRPRRSSPPGPLGFAFHRHDLPGPCHGDGRGPHQPGDHPQGVEPRRPRPPRDPGLRRVRRRQREADRPRSLGTSTTRHPRGEGCRQHHPHAEAGVAPGRRSASPSRGIAPPWRGSIFLFIHPCEKMDVAGCLGSPTSSSSTSPR